MWFSILPLIALTGFSGVAKFWLLDRFLSELGQAALIPSRAIGAIAWGVPSLLCATCVTLLLGFWWPRMRLVGLLAFGALMTVFTMYITGILLMEPEERPCDCLGLAEDLGIGWVAHYWLNIGFLMLGTGAFLLHRWVRRPEFNVNGNGAEAQGSIKKAGEFISIN